MKRVRYIEDELIARAMLTGLVAAGGTGKGLYGVHIAAKLALVDEPTLFLCSEDALNYIVRPRFEAAGCDARLAVALDLEDASGDAEPAIPVGHADPRGHGRPHQPRTRDRRPVRQPPRPRAEHEPGTTRSGRRSSR